MSNSPRDSDRAVERQTDLSAVRMTGEDQIETMIAKTVCHFRIMHEQDATLGLSIFEGVDSDQGHADQLEIVLRQNNTSIDQPRAAGRGKGALAIGKGRA